MAIHFYNARKNENAGRLAEAAMFPEMRWVNLRAALAAAVELKNPTTHHYPLELEEKIEREKKEYKNATSKRGSLVFYKSGDIVRQVEILHGKPFARAYKGMMLATCNGYEPSATKSGVKFDAGDWGKWRIKPDGTVTVEIIVDHHHYELSDTGVSEYAHERGGEVIFKMTVYPDGRAVCFQTEELPVYKKYKVFGRVYPLTDHAGDIARIKKAFGV